MKTLLISLSILFSSLSIFSQSLIELRNRLAYTNGSFSTELHAYKTHFLSSTNLKIYLVKQNDTAKIIYNPYIFSENELNFYVSSFPSPGSYDLYVSNSIDSIMYLPNAVQVFSNNANIEYQEVKDNRFDAGIDTSINFRMYNSNILTAGIDTAYFINSNDTIWPDSIFVLSNDSIRLDLTIPNDAVGFYDLVLSNSIDSTMMSLHFLKVYNPSLTQIANLTPDSIDNTYWLPQLITVYGNNTHFTSDTNVIYFTDFYVGVDDIDSLKVINDSLLTFTVFLPMGVKNAVEPNTILSVYNSVDGILRFPMEIILYGSIGDPNTVFSKIECYPNPANDFITISSEDFANEKSLSIEIFSIDGKKVSSELYQNKSSITLDIQNLARGVYLAKVKGEEKISSFKFIVQ